VSADYDLTRERQRQASDPASSAWVVANAGSGKTHVLTQRVIRLLLAGADPAAILCLTFTKVAAAEMARRVFDALGRWAMLPDAELAAEIDALQGRAPDAAEMRAARRLFARALETPGGLKIQTIHAFCERLLHQFPFEANVPGQCAILDESASASLIAAARAEVMNRAAAAPETPLGRAVRQMAELANDIQIGEALDDLIAKRDQVRRWVAMSGGEGGGGIADALADLRKRLKLGADETEDSICRAICHSAEWACETCSDLAAALAGFRKSADRNATAALEAISTGDAANEADGRLEFFLSSDSSGWKVRSATHRFSADFAKSRPGLRESFAAEAERVLALAQRLNLARAFAATEALLVVGDAILQAYHRAKRQAGALDFADLIAKTRNLLSRADASEWVLYKLDRRIEHILVDEAQDTSPDQWMVVQALAEDFFSGAGASAKPRTIFAVGDDKQSIFGFQGAAPEMLAEMQRFFARRIAEAEAPFVALPLSLSFRSTQQVLTAVDTVFDQALAEKITASTYEAHAAYRESEPGHVVVMPRIVRQKVVEPEDWTAPYDAPSAAETDLANRIAEEIEALRGTLLPSGKRLREGEILVLVRRRDAFFAAMNRALRARQIPTAGADRIPVASHIAVLDLLALADVMLLPDDDLQLAALLKSPLCGLSEDALMRLATGREHRSLWSALQAAGGEFAAVAERLRGWRAMADQVTPFRFFATILGPDFGRRAFRARLGGEADDVLDTFLSQAPSYESVETPSLQGFVRFIRANEADIKRETEEAATGVRVMTVHGAKGLEADVVFLVDTGGLVAPTGQRDVLVPIGAGRDDPAFLWRRLQKEAPEAQREADAIADGERAREYLRLLYVAMTRARDVLYVAGIKAPGTPDDCWYQLVASALVPDDVERDSETGALVAPYTWREPARPPLAARPEEQAAVEEIAPPPKWLFRPAPTPVPAPEPLRPSRGLAEPDPAPAAAPEMAAEALGDTALLRGRIVHLLLERLPGLPAEDRRAAAERLLQRELPGDPALAASILAEAEAVLADPALAAVFGPESRAELAIVGHVATARGEYAVSGRIDRMVREDAGWHIVDFKTNRAVPADPAEADPAYILQLALYRRLLMEMEPGAAVRASLVWTAGPNVMPIRTSFMEQALEKLEIRGNSVP